MAAKGLNYGKGIVGLWRQGWCEIPEIMSTGCLVLISIPFGIHGLYRIERDHVELKRFRYDYKVFRHDDPRVAKLVKKQLHPDE